MNPLIKPGNVSRYLMSRVAKDRIQDLKKDVREEGSLAESTLTLKAARARDKGPFAKYANDDLETHQQCKVIVAQKGSLALDAYKEIWYWVLTIFSTSSGLCAASATISSDVCSIWPCEIDGAIS